MADSSAMLTQGEPKGAPVKPPAVARGTGKSWWPGFKNYLIETKAEILRITWPGQDDWVNSSVITLLTIVVLAGLMALYNAIFNYIAGWLFGA